MNKILLIAAAALFMLPGSLAARSKKAHAAKKDTIAFTTIKANPITSIKDQNQSGTCWAYSSLGYFEAELLRMGKGTTSASLSSFTTLTWIVPTRPFVLMATLASHKVAHSTMPFTA